MASPLTRRATSTNEREAGHFVFPADHRFRDADPAWLPPDLRYPASEPAHRPPARAADSLQPPPARRHPEHRLPVLPHGRGQGPPCHGAKPADVLELPPDREGPYEVG